MKKQIDKNIDTPLSEVDQLRARLLELEESNQRLSAFEKHSTRILDGLNTINRVVAPATDLDDMLDQVLNKYLDIFSADRAWFLFPCDLNAKTWHIPKERTRPQWPGGLAEGVEVPVDDFAKSVFTEALTNPGVVRFDSQTNPFARFSDVHATFGIRSQLIMAIHPKIGKPWLMGIHHCEQEQTYTETDCELFEILCGRVGDSLSSLLHSRKAIEIEKTLNAGLEQSVRDRTLELSNERDHARQYLQIAGSMIVALDADGRVVLANRKACDVLGWEPDALTGLDWFETAIPDEERSEVHGAFQQILAGKLDPVEDFQNHVVTRDGQKRLIDWHNTYITDDNGTINGCLSSGQDITEQKRTEEALKRSEQDFRLITDTLPVGMTYLDRNLHFRMVNTTYANWFDKRREDLVGGYVREFIGESGMTAMKDYFLQVLSGETVRYERRLSLPGGPIDISVTMVPDIKDDGDIDGFFALAIDVTGQKLAEQKVIQSAKMATLGEMATGIAHELNQPLNVIRMAVSNIQRKTSRDKIDPDYLSDKLDKVEKQVERAAAIIDHMRIFGRKSADTMSPLVASDVVTATLGLIGQQLRLQDIDVVTPIENSDCLIFGHQVQIEQVLLNLLGNARDALNSNNIDNKRIIFRVGIDSKSGLVCIDVEDNGGGIDPVHLPRIFEPFFTTKEVGMGTGLGLSISYGIINDMGGTLEARNTEDGACFSITLPVHDPA